MLMISKYFKIWPLTLNINKFYVYWTVPHLTSLINWTNLTSLYESFYCSTCFECYYIHPQELTAVCGCTVLFRCVLMCAGWSASAPTCTRIPPFSSRTAPIHQYTPKHSNSPKYRGQLLRMNVITLETCWAIKNLHKVTSIWFNLFNY